MTNEKKCSKHANMEGVYFTYMGWRNPLMDCVKILFSDRHQWGNYVYQIWWWSVQGFRWGVKSVPCPIDFAGHPYNSAMLPPGDGGSVVVV